MGLGHVQYINGNVDRLQGAFMEALALLSLRHLGSAQMQPVRISMIHLSTDNAHTLHHKHAASIAGF